MAQAPGEAVGEALDRLRLVAGRLEGGDELEVGHGRKSSRRPTLEPNTRSTQPPRAPAAPAPEWPLAPSRGGRSPPSAAPG